MKNSHSESKIKLLIVEDHRIIIEGLLLVLSRIERFGQITASLHTYYLIDTIEKNA